MRLLSEQVKDKILSICFRDTSFMDDHMFSGYVKSLPLGQRRQYFTKLRLEYPFLHLPDPYKSEGWINDMKKWPDLNVSNLHQYLLGRQELQSGSDDTPCASLEGYNAFMQGYVQEVEYFSISRTSPVCLLKAFIVSPHLTERETCLAWVCLGTTDGTVKASHCTCLKK